MATVLPPSHSVLADIPWQKLEWSDDAMTLLFLTTGGRTDLISFSVEQQRYETLATDVNIRLVTWFPSPRGTQLVVPWSSTPGTRQLDLMASDGQHRITVWHGPNDIAQILASPDGKYVAFRLIDDVNRLFWLKVNTIDLHEVNP